VTSAKQGGILWKTFDEEPEKQMCAKNENHLDLFKKCGNVAAFSRANFILG
jgi:hypothetical protein